MSFIGTTTKQRRRGFGLRRQSIPTSNKPSSDNRDDDGDISGKRTITERRRPIRNGYGLLKKLNFQRSVSDCSITIPLAVDEEERTVENSTNNSTSIPEVNSPRADEQEQKEQHEKSVTFGATEYIEVPCWKDNQELWWSSSEIEQSRHSQNLVLMSNESTRLYLNAYQAAYKQLTNGGDKELRLPPGLRKGLERGHAGAECFSSLEERRRRRGRQIVRTIVAFSSFLRDPEELREHAERLNAPSLQWARTMGDAHSEANRYSMSVGLLQK